MKDIDLYERHCCIRCGDSSVLYRYFNLDYLLGSLGIQRETEVKGLVCPECRDEIIEKAKGRFDEKLGI
jgi:hypothetical protein